MPGVFYRTKLVTIMPRFMIVNRMPEKISLRQYEVKAGRSEGICRVGSELCIEAYDVR